MNATRKCSIPECRNPSRARGWCRNHYSLWRRHGEPAPQPKGKKPAVDCAVSGCTKVSFARGWCRTHYTRWYETGSLELGVRTGKGGPAVTSLEARFWAKVNKAGGTAYASDPLAMRAEGECWLWTASGTSLGYGAIWDHSIKRARMAHRVSLELSTGKALGADLVVDHLCRTPSCVNPSHLELVTVAENTKRGLAPLVGFARNRRKTHCPGGHEYSEENTYRYNDGRARVCRTCAITRTQQRRIDRVNNEQHLL